MAQRSIKRTGYSSTRQMQMTNDDLFDTQDYDHVWPARKPSSTRRYQSDIRTEPDSYADVEAVTDYPTTQPARKSSVPARSTATQASIPVAQSNRKRVSDTDEIYTQRTESVHHRGPRFHWLFYVGVAMLIMIAGWQSLSYLSSWWQVAQDDLHYGRPRTFQTDQVVNHNDSSANKSHFIALNLNRHVEVIEFPGGDPAKAKVYVVGPTLIGPGQDLTPVTLTFKDVNGDGKLDMVVNIQDSRLVFINENGEFRPLHPGENAQL